MDYLKQKFPFSHKNFFLKSLLTIFFLGLAFCILFFDSLSPLISPVLESPFPEKVTLPEPQNPPQTSTVLEHVPELLPVPQHPTILEHAPELLPVPETPTILEHAPETEDQLSPTDSSECWVITF